MKFKLLTTLMKIGNYYEKIIIFYIVLVGIIITLAVPPFQKPDEIVHFRKAMAVSQGYFFCNSSNLKIQSTKGIEVL